MDDRLFSEDPMTTFGEWYEAAEAQGGPTPESVVLATATPDGRPSARVVLLRGYDARGFVFYTNYESRKGKELAMNPFASLCFHWPFFERQVRVEGRVERVSPNESEAYFRSRPLGSRHGAWASPQSRVIPDRGWLEARVSEFEAKYPGDEVPRPEHWGGYRLRAESIELWVGQPSRLHDRMRYLREGSGWRRERLAP